MDNTDLDVECITWLSTFLNKDSIYIDIGFGNGIFIHRFDFCKEIIAYENEEKNIIKLKNTASDINKIKIYNRIPTPLEIKKNIIDLVRINIENVLQILILYEDIFVNNVKHIFTKILRDDEREKLISMDYSIVEIKSINMILAINKKFDPYHDIKNYDDKTIVKKYDHKTIIENYIFDDLTLDQIDDIHVWDILISHYKKQNKQSTIKCLKYLIENTKNTTKIYSLHFLLGLCGTCDAYNILNKVIFSVYSPYIYTNKALEKQSEYVKKIKPKETVSVFCEKDGYFSSTPSVTIIDGLFYVFTRMINYKINKNGEYIIYGEKCISLYDVSIYNQNMKLISKKELNVDHYKKYPSNVLGVEDIRIYNNNKIFFISYEVTEKNTPAVCCGKFLHSTNMLTDIKHLSISNISEKNWLPFVVNDETHFIYSILPLKIYKIKNDEIKLCVDNFKSIMNFTSLRGSSPPILYNNGLIFVAHQVCDRTSRKCKLYLHRFVWLSKDYNVIKIGKLFYFHELGVEYNTTLIDTGNEFILSYSHMDSSSYIIKVSYDSVEYDLLFDNNNLI